MNLIRVMPAEGMQLNCITNPSSNPEEGLFLRAVIFANGNFNPSASILSTLRDDDLLIAADGGAKYCLAAGLWPNTVIGDMDSLSHSLMQDLKNHGSQLVEFSPDKDKTDLELALTYAVQQGALDILLLGLLGGRLDQSMANILLLTRNEWKDLNLIVSDEPDIAYLMHENDTVSIQGKPGDIVSLIPLSKVVTDVTTHGLRWQLDQAKLIMGSTLSVSNELLKTNAKIQIGSGKLFLIHRDTHKKGSEE
jgi:thiamine pyrophosphokinase